MYCVRHPGIRWNEDGYVRLCWEGRPRHWPGWQGLTHASTCIHCVQASRRRGQETSCALVQGFETEALTRLAGL